MEEKFELIILKVTTKKNDVIAHCISLEKVNDDQKHAAILDKVDKCADYGDVILLYGTLNFLNDEDSYKISGSHRKWYYPEKYENIDCNQWFCTKIVEKPSFLDKLLYKNTSFTHLEGVAVAKEGVDKDFIVPRQKIIIIKHYD